MMSGIGARLSQAIQHRTLTDELPQIYSFIIIRTTSSNAGNVD
jgi:hypothetical protein